MNITLIIINTTTTNIVIIIGFIILVAFDVMITSRIIPLIVINRIAIRTLDFLIVSSMYWTNLTISMLPLCHTEENLENLLIIIKFLCYLYLYQLNWCCYCFQHYPFSLIIFTIYF